MTINSLEELLTIVAELVDAVADLEHRVVAAERLLHGHSGELWRRYKEGITDVTLRGTGTKIEIKLEAARKTLSQS